MTGHATAKVVRRKTSLHVDVALMHRAKVRAAELGVTLGDALEQGLRLWLGAPPSSSPFDELPPARRAMLRDLALIAHDGEQPEVLQIVQLALSLAARQQNGTDGL